MAVDIHLFCIRRSCSRGRHEAISHFVRIDTGLILIESLEFFDKGIEGFGVVFRDKEFNAGGIKGKDPGKGRINEVAERFGKINHPAEHKLNERLKVLTESCKKRGIGDFGEAAEIPKFFAEGKKKDKQRIGGNRKNLLKDEGRQETG